MQSKVKVMGDFSHVNEEEKSFFDNRIEKFEERHADAFKEMHMKIDCHVHKETSRGRSMHHVKVFIDGDKGRYHADNHDFSADKALKGAFEKIERQMDR